MFQTDELHTLALYTLFYAVLRTVCLFNVWPSVSINSCHVKTTVFLFTTLKTQLKTTNSRHLQSALDTSVCLCQGLQWSKDHIFSKSSPSSPSEWIKVDLTLPSSGGVEFPTLCLANTWICTFSHLDLCTSLIHLSENHRWVRFII